MTPVRSDELDVTLDRDADVPIGVQLAWALRARIRAGALAPGARLPALQRLAQDLGVNPNTVRAVYARLEQDGLVATRHGSGTFVCDQASAGGADGSATPLAQLVSGAARAARDAGVDPRELAAALYVGGEQAPAGGGSAWPAPAGAQRNAATAARRRLRDEVAALDRALADLLARRPDVAAQLAHPDEQAPSLPPQARLLSTAELEAQRDVLLRRLIEAQALAAAPPDEEPPSSGSAQRQRAAATSKPPRRTPAARPAVAKLRPAPRAAT